MSRRDEGRKERISRNISPKGERWYIYSEGKETEPNYLNGLFKCVDKEKINPIIEGLGMVSLSLVNDVIEKEKDIIIDHKTFVLFDKDDNSNNNFNLAIDNAKHNNIIPLWSNECFELWLLLHFNYMDSNISRYDYYEKLKSLTKSKKYEKNMDNIFEEVNGINGALKAYKNAKKLYKTYKSKSYKDMAPCTTVFILIDEIKKVSDNLSDKN